jgi:hypothetical protein
MWETETFGSTSYHVYKQQHGESCGPSSVLMLMRQVDGTLTAEAMVRLWFTQTESAQKKAGQTVYGAKAGKDARIFDFSGGAGLETILKVLTTKRSTYNAVWGGAIRDCTASSPGIVRVQWPDKGGHFIVCLGNALQDSGGNRLRTYLDPWYGLVYNRHDMYPMYDTTTGSFGEGAARGRITHMVTTSPP